MPSVEAYIINIEGQVDRKIYAADEAKKMGVTPKIIKAITPADFKSNSNSVFNRSVEACWLSHRKVLGDFLAGSADYALVMEDDIVLRNAKRAIQCLNQALLYDFDVYQVGFLKEGVLNRTEIALKNCCLLYTSDAADE